MYGCGLGSGIRMGWEVFSQNTQFEIGVVGKHLAKNTQFEIGVGNSVKF